MFEFLLIRLLSTGMSEGEYALLPMIWNIDTKYDTVLG